MVIGLGITRLLTASPQAARWSHDCADYLIQVPLGLGLCLLASLYAHGGLQFAMALLHIAYQLCWTARVVTAPL